MMDVKEMQNIESPQPKTIGDSINELVAEYGQSTFGIYILECALCQAVGARHIRLDDNRCISEMPRYKEIWQAEQEMMAKALAILKEMESE